MAALSPPFDGSTKRRKITRACDACKAKKKRCSGTQPCPSCERAAKPCTYLASYTRGRFKTPPPPLPLPPPPRAGLDALVLAAESSAHDDSTTTTATTIDDAALVSARHHHKARPRQSQKRSAAAAGGKIPRAFAEVRIPSPEELQQRAYLTPSSHDPPAACFRADAFRHHGESWRPLPPDPERILVDDPPSRGASLEPEATLDGHYLGPDSGIAWLRRAWRKLGQAHHEMGVEETSAEAGNRSSGSIFTYGDKETPVDHDAGFTFPSPERADYLVGRYFEYAAPTYRFLHRPTLVSWLAAMQDPTTASSVSPARQAVVLLVFATATIYELNKHDHAKPDAAIRTEGESYQRAAREHLSREAGAPTLESAQARFALCHFLLSTSRPNEAWFTFGTTAQLALALGLHRRQRERAAPSNGARSAETGDVLVARECRRRLFWSMYTLDTYLSVMFGRPRLLRDEDITQPLPQALNDEDIAPEAGSAAAAPRPASPASDADCVMHAAIFHARLARILSRAIALQQRQRRHRRRSGSGGSAESGEGEGREEEEEQRALSAAAGLHAELDAWKARLPPFLSGAIRPSSLIPVFRRQATVLQIAYAHAVMFVGRGFLVGGDVGGGGSPTAYSSSHLHHRHHHHNHHHNHNAQASPSHTHTHSHSHPSQPSPTSQHSPAISTTSSSTSSPPYTTTNTHNHDNIHTSPPAKPTRKHLASATLKAASSALNLVRTFVAEKQPFPAFWFSQHIAFNALAVLWVWVLERRERSELRHRGELSQRGELNSLRGQGEEFGRGGGGGGRGERSDGEDDEVALLALADTVHGHLAAVGEHSAPCLRYGIVLRELRDEVGGVGVGVGGGGGEGGGADGSRSTALMEGDPHGKPLYAPAAAELRPSGLLLQSQSQQQQQAEPSTATATVTTGGGGDWSNNINGASAAAVGDVAGVDADADADAPFDLGGCGWGGWGLGVEFWPRLDALPLGETF